MEGIRGWASAQILQTHHEGKGAACRIERLLETDQLDNPSVGEMTMQQFINVRLNDQVFQIEEDGYNALRQYLDRAKAGLKGNLDMDEILADIERSIAEKCSASLTASGNLVSSAQVARVIDEMGPVENA